LGAPRLCDDERCSMFHFFMCPWRMTQCKTCINF
jgi:hypothetical protein